MALIECASCGKKISDTTKSCIHCGAPVGALSGTQSEKTELVQGAPKAQGMGEVAESKERKEENLQAYSKLPQSKKIMLEKQFLDSDGRAYLFKRRGEEYSKFLKLSSIACETFLIYSLIVRALNAFVPDFTIISESFYNASVGIATGLLAVGLVGLISCIILRRIHKKSIKQYVYLKRYARWLEERRNMRYSFNYLSNKEKAIIMEIDLDKMKL